jgi:hypothetical protein
VRIFRDGRIEMVPREAFPLGRGSRDLGGKAECGIGGLCWARTSDLADVNRTL